VVRARARARARVPSPAHILPPVSSLQGDDDVMLVLNKLTAMFGPAVGAGAPGGPGGE
jgi:hypothetical protein